MSAEQPYLIEYGIHTEDSDIRAHCSPSTMKVYVYRTKAGLEALSKKEYKVKPAFQPGVSGPTATGWLVPPGDIPGLRTIPLGPTWWKKFHKEDSTSNKGKAAVELVVELLKIGHFPLWISAGESSDSDVQIKGTDIVIFARKKIQVKCDWHAGDPSKSGCLFLQQSERNPLKLV